MSEAGYWFISIVAGMFTICAIWVCIEIWIDKHK